MQLYIMSMSRNCHLGMHVDVLGMYGIMVCISIQQINEYKLVN